MMLIVVPPKGIDLLLRVVDRSEPMHVQTFFSEASIERFDRGIVRRFAAATEVEDDAVRVRPENHRRTDELCSVVAVNPDATESELGSFPPDELSRAVSPPGAATTTAAGTSWSTARG